MKRLFMAIAMLSGLMAAVAADFGNLGQVDYFFSDDNKTLTIRRASTLSSSVTEVAVGSFFWTGDVTIMANSASVENIVVESGVTSIGASAFQFDNLVSITLPDGIKSIEDYAFQGTKITSIELPSTLESLGDAPFEQCSSLMSIKCAATAPPVFSNTHFFPSTSIALLVPSGSVATYSAANGWKTLTNISGYSSTGVDDADDDVLKEVYVDMSGRVMSAMPQGQTVIKVTVMKSGRTTVEKVMAR